MSVTHNVTLDVDKRRFCYEQAVHVRVGDKATQTVTAALTKNGASYSPPSGSTAKIEVLKHDNTWSVSSATISGSSVSGVLPLEAMSCPGECKRAYFRITNSAGTQEDTTEDFYLYVFPNAYDDAIESRPYSDQLDELIAAADQELQDTIEEVRDMRTGYDGTVHASAGDAMRAADASLDATSRVALELKAFEFSVVGGTPHSSTKDRILFPVKAGDRVAVTCIKEANCIIQVFDDSASIGSYWTTLSGVRQTFTCPRDSETFGFYVSSDASQDITVIVELEDSNALQMSHYRDDLALCRRGITSFKVMKGANHSSTVDQVRISVSAGEIFRVRVGSDTAGNVGMFARTDGSMVQYTSALAIGDWVYFKALADIDALGFNCSAPSGSDRHVEALVEARKKANRIENMAERARLYGTEVRACMDRVRYSADHLEMLVDDELWPMPKYRELLFF